MVHTIVTAQSVYTQLDSLDTVVSAFSTFIYIWNKQHVDTMQFIVANLRLDLS
jgi:hypothetical protein